MSGIPIKHYCMLMRVRIDCPGCYRKLRRVILNMKEIETHSVEMQHCFVNVCGRFRPSDVAIKLRKKLNRRVEILEIQDYAPTDCHEDHQNPQPCAGQQHPPHGTSADGQADHQTQQLPGPNTSPVDHMHSQQPYPSQYPCGAGVDGYGPYGHVDHQMMQPTVTPIVRRRRLVSGNNLRTPVYHWGDFEQTQPYINQYSQVIGDDGYGSYDHAYYQLMQPMALPQHA
ncbi:hypothetical protein NMG60_11018986 [Bertholletia excelsa]